MASIIKREWSDVESDLGSEVELSSDSENESSTSAFSDSEASENDSETELDPGNAALQKSREWWKVDHGNVPPPPPRFPFTGRPAVNYVHQEDGGILQYFDLFFDDELVEKIAIETNIYASQSIAASPANKRARLQERWTATTGCEIRVYLAIVLAQSLIRKPDQKLYWSTNEVLSTSFFPQTMTRDRFEKLKQYLHFSNNATYDPQSHPNPKLRKVLPVFCDLAEKFQKFYTPDRDITIGDSLLLYKGRVGWVQYIPLKGARFGIKTYLLCDSKTGYVWRMIIYTGKGTILNDQYNDLNVSSQVVMTLTGPLLDQGYCLTTDNFYTSPQLADLLIAHKTDTYGTVRLTRKEMPKELQSTKLQKGQVIAFTRGKVMTMKWKDKKEVTLLSTIHNSEMVEVIKRGERVLKPRVVTDYIGAMGRVDIVDHHLPDYSQQRKRSKKYYKKIFFYLVDLALCNGYIIYTKSGGQLSPLKFRLSLISEMVRKYWVAQSPRPVARSRNDSLAHRLSGQHFPESIPAAGKKLKHQKQCVVCSKLRDPETGKKLRRDTRYQCDNCKVALCVIGCFRLYHTEDNI